MCDLLTRPERGLDLARAGLGTWEAACDASRNLLLEQGPLADPTTDLEAAVEVDELAALLVAYGCVPAARRGPLEATEPKLEAPATASD